MIEWFRDFFGLNRYAVRTILLNGRHNNSGAISLRSAKRELEQRRLWQASRHELVRLSGGRGNE
ncbi:hypothetical protein HAAEEKHM_00058 [Sinorhizobium phage AP-16-3]|nr:hypothetical protein HAAEEKHM_00058 [Sinorhizobium phage AP-16-3]